MSVLRQVSLAQAMFGDSTWWAAMNRKDGISCGSQPTIARWCNFLAFLARFCGDEGLKSLRSEALALLLALCFWEACAIVDARISLLAEDFARAATTSKRYQSMAMLQRRVISMDMGRGPRLCGEAERAVKVLYIYERISMANLTGRLRLNRLIRLTRLIRLK